MKPSIVANSCGTRLSKLGYIWILKRTLQGHQPEFDGLTSDLNGTKVEEPLDQLIKRDHHLVFCPSAIALGEMAYPMAPSETDSKTTDPLVKV